MKSVSFYFTLVPVFGFFPAWWRLYRQQGSAQELAISRLAITLAFLWLSGYILFGTAAQTTELGSLPVLIGGSLWTTTYFLMCFGLMVRLSRGKSLWLPGIGNLSDRLP